MILQLSHSANNIHDWFIVLPLPGDTKQSMVNTPITNRMAVASLLEIGRTVYEIDTKAGSIKQLSLAAVEATSAVEPAPTS